jgi:hypothetical protein
MHENAIELIGMSLKETKLSEQFYKEPDNTEEETPQDWRFNPGKDFHFLILLPDLV